MDQLQNFLNPPSAPFCSISVSKSEKPANCAKANLGLSFPGPFLLKPGPSQVSLGSLRLGNVAQVPRNRAQLGQIQRFPNPPSAPFSSISVSKSERPAHCPKANSGLSFPRPFLLKPKPSQVSLVSWRLRNLAQSRANKVQGGQIQSFPNQPLGPF